MTSPAPVKLLIALYKIFSKPSRSSPWFNTSRPAREYAVIVSYRLSRASLSVAVGTTIADRPPHRSVRARLRIRLLMRMSGVEALTRIGMQDAGFRNPPVQQWDQTIPSHLRALTATD
jgi:hypothetical protein